MAAPTNIPFPIQANKPHSLLKAQIGHRKEETGSFVRIAKAIAALAGFVEYVRFLDPATDTVIGLSRKKAKAEVRSQF